MTQPTTDRPIVHEIYRALVLLGAGNDLLGTVNSWKDSLPDEDVLANLQAWNAATLAESKGRIEHYDIVSRHLVYNPDDGQKTSAALL